MTGAERMWNMRVKGMEAAERLNLAQAKHDGLMAMLPSKFAEVKSAIQWLQPFVEAAEHVAVIGTDFPRVASVLEASGWKANEACGLPHSSYEDPNVLGRWIIGQAIDMLRKNIPPHPLLAERALGLISS